MPMTLDAAPVVLTVQEAAEVVRVDPKTIYAAIRRGELRALVSGRVIRVHRDALKRWLMGELAEAAS